MPKVSFATFNLLNLNLPGLRIYSDADGWDQDVYDRKVAWAASMLNQMESDIWGFEELWHGQALQEVFEAAGLADDYELLVPPGQEGQRIVCAGAVRKEILVGEPRWIDAFPEKFRLSSSGGDDQTCVMNVSIDQFSRPVLHFQVKPHPDCETISVYVNHFKSKGPTRINREDWYEADEEFYSKHREGLGSALSTIRRTAEAAALRMILTEEMVGSETPVVVMGDLNDGLQSNTLNVLTGQPRYLLSDSTGGSDVDLYAVGTLQRYRSLRDVYYTHVFNNTRESLDHILVSQEFYDHSQKRLWVFDGMEVSNDHLNREDHRESGTTDHGILRASFDYRPL